MAGNYKVTILLLIRRPGKRAFNVFASDIESALTGLEIERGNFICSMSIQLTGKCNYVDFGKFTGYILVRKPSRYMIKKYGYAKAFDINLKKAIKQKRNERTK